jgi:hypothetical protein
MGGFASSKADSAHYDSADSAAVPECEESKEEMVVAAAAQEEQPRCSNTGVGGAILDWNLEVLSFLPAREALQALCAVKQWHALLFGPEPNAAIWKWCCEKFAHDHLLFCPEGIREGKRCDIDWRAYFDELVAIRDLWSDGTLSDTQGGRRRATDYSVKVAVRFRPSDQDGR